MFLSPSFALAQTSFDRFVVFGTSLSDSGNIFATNKELNLPPGYAVDGLLVPDAPYARGGHHLSNGATWVEQLAKSLGMARSTQPASRSNNPHAMNYATDGTRASSLVFPDKKLFSQQVDNFLADVNHSASVDALHVIEVGSNDIRDALGALLTGLQ
ncbi:MAG: SGNH/GDSL hydrolase family protein, partial [Nitrosomonas sp.]|nr:SGNH/GDSL hydrolase family protein [Nitrosomonas sp.]